MKKLFLILLAAILLLTSCEKDLVQYPYNKENYKDWSGLKPIIPNFNGDMFSDMNITAGGRFTGSKRLGVFGDMLHCGDNGLTIWYDYNNGNLYKLNSEMQKSKICQLEECRNDIEKQCFHMPIANYVYSDGFLYFTYGGQGYAEVEYQGEMYLQTVSKGVCIYRYNIDTYEVEKLIEFQGVDCCGVALNGKYLYAISYTWEFHEDTKSMYKTDYAITRIDLNRENAVIVYSYVTDRTDFDKISDDPYQFRFINDRIVMPVNDYSLNKSSINISNAEMNYIVTLIEFEYENIRNVYLYDNNIYFMAEKWIGKGEDAVFENRLCRVSIEMYDKYLMDFVLNPQKGKTALLDSNKREILRTNVKNFCIDGDFLYYTVNGESTIYRIILDYSRELNFNTSTLVYTPESGESINPHDWIICDMYLYATSVIDDDLENSGWRYRKKLFSESGPYLFYREY